MSAEPMSQDVPASADTIVDITACLAALFLQDLKHPPVMTEENVDAWARWSKRLQAHAVCASVVTAVRADRFSGDVPYPRSRYFA